MNSQTVVHHKELFMTINNIAWMSRKYPSVSAWEVRNEMQLAMTMSAVIVSSSCYPNENMTLWIAVVGKQMSRNDVKRVLSALGWIFREFTEKKLDAENIAE
jgi:aspartate aminotransferase-like enzyme